jgi:hypothetical protein
VGGAHLAPPLNYVPFGEAQKAKATLLAQSPWGDWNSETPVLVQFQTTTPDFDTPFLVRFQTTRPDHADELWKHGEGERSWETAGTEGDENRHVAFPSHRAPHMNLIGGS